MLNTIYEKVDIICMMVVTFSQTLTPIVSFIMVKVVRGVLRGGILEIPFL